MDRRRTFLMVSIGLSLIIAGLMVLPYIGYVISGLLLAFLFHPVQERLEPVLNSSVAAAIMLVLTVVGAILPLVIIAGAVAGDATQFVTNLQEQGLPQLQGVENQIELLTDIEIDLEERLSSFLESVASAISFSGVLSMLSHLTLGITLMLFAEFYGLKQGDDFLDWLKGFESLPTDIMESLYSGTADITRAMIEGHIGVAAVQGALIGIALFITEIPNPAFWGFVTALMGLVPIIGITVIYIPAAAYLLTTGSTLAGIAFLVWSLLVSGLTDDILRPYLVEGRADLHPFLIILGVIGGISIFGAIGIFIGPIFLGITKILLIIYREEE